MFSYFIIIALTFQGIFSNLIVANKTSNSILKLKIKSIVSDRSSSSSNQISCYFLTQGYDYMPNVQLTKVDCLEGDNCVKVVEYFASSKTRIWKGCSSDYFTMAFEKIGTNFVPNTCVNGEYKENTNLLVQTTLCGCKDQDYCNSGASTSSVTILFVTFLLFILQ